MEITLYVILSLQQFYHAFAVSMVIYVTDEVIKPTYSIPIIQIQVMFDDFENIRELSDEWLVKFIP